MADIAVGVVLALAEKITIFLHKTVSRSSTNNVHGDVEKASNCLKEMQAYIRDNSSALEQIDDDEEAPHSQMIQTRVKLVQDIAYEIEDILDKFLLHISQEFQSNRFSTKLHDLWKIPKDWRASREFSKAIKHIIENKIRFLSSLDEINHPQGPHQQVRARSGDNYSSTHVSSHFLEEEEIVGFEEPKENLVKQLVEEDNSRPLTIISIVGPGGCGKTTLLKIVFKSKRVQGFFDCRAWIDVPRDLCARKLDELLLNMLREFYPKGKRQEPFFHEDPKAQLALVFEDKKFVVVLDNVRSKQDLELVINALPNGFWPGSKVVITTRNSDIHSCNSRAISPEHIHDLSQGLPWKEACNLFCKKAFRDREGKCPPELQNWAELILKKCEGLPLAISAVGSLLASYTTPNEWKNLHDSLGSNLLVIGKMLQPSYKDLPSHLKTCFLYFGMFPEDYSVSRERLIRLWVAEGFVMPKISSRKTMEEIAAGYLDELIGRNLVHVSSREVDGRVRSCRVLNLVREFIIGKVENLITVFEEENRYREIIHGERIRCLSIQNATLTNFSEGRNLSCVRCILVFGQENQDAELERVLKTFEFIRVLDLQGVSLENFPDSVFGRLTLLRYISLRKTNIKKVPKSIKKLGFLETLDLKHTQVTKLPAKIYALRNLRHLLVYRYDVTNYVTFGAARGVEVSAGNIAALTSLQKLSLIKVKNNIEIIRALGKLKGLRKLGLVDLERKDGWELCCSIQKMESLSTLDVRSTSEEEYLDLDQMQSPPSSLQHLYLKGRLERLPQWIHRLQSLAKIGLKWSKLNADEDPLEALQTLPNLVELDLVHYYTGEQLEFKEGTFMKLKALCIEELDQLNTIVVQNNAMPELKKLTLCKCQSLKLLPLGMEGLTKLDELLLFDMHNDFIAKLQKNAEDRQVVEHIQVIHSFYLQGTNQSFTGFQNLS